MMGRALLPNLVSFCGGSALTLAAIGVIGGENAHSGATIVLFSAHSWPWAMMDLKVAAFTATIAVGALVLLAFGGEIRTAANVISIRTKQALSPGRPSKEIRPTRLPDVAAAREELEAQLGRLVVLLTRHIERSKEQAITLRQANDDLAVTNDVGQIREIVEHLINNNQKTQRDTSELEARLEEAQRQAAGLRQRLTQAEKLASVDPLTQVANRRRFEQFLGAEVERSHQDGTPLCLVMTDIDHFKSVNDTYGHAVGDEVLKAFADLLAKCVRSTDLVARYGGEEFAIVLTRTPMGNAHDIAERVRASFQSSDWARHKQTAGVASLTASFGIAEIRDGEPPSTLIKRADKKLYEAKGSGRNRVAIWPTTQREDQAAKESA